MGRIGFIAIIFVFLFASTTCDASLVFHLRKLISDEGGHNASTTSQPQVPPIESPAKDSNTNTSSIDTEKSQSDKDNQINSNGTSPLDPKESNKPNNDTKNLGAPSPPAGEKNGSIVDGDKPNMTAPKLDDNGSCEGSISTCKNEEMLACIKASRDGGIVKMFLVTKNKGENTLKLNVKVPNSLEDILQEFEVPKHSSKRMNISTSLGKSSKLIVNSGSGSTCELVLVQPVSVDKIVQQLTFYSKQVTPIYAVYASLVVTFLLGGTWACCRLKKRKQQDGVQYEELEMGIPESASAAAADVEGWDHDWDDDWEEEIAVKSPSGHQVRSVSADGLTKRDGWDNDWDD